jgi:hypothetical protein
VTGWKEISQQQNLELSRELLERQGTINDLKAEVERLTSELAEANDRAEVANNLHANAEYMLAETKARNARLEELFQERVENRRWMVGELRRHNSQLAQLERLCRDNDVWLHRDQVLEILNGEGEMAEPCQPIGCDNGHHLIGCAYATLDAGPDPERAELAVIERRVAADKRVLDAAELVRDASAAVRRHNLDIVELELRDAVDARRALVEVEDTPQPQDHDEAYHDLRLLTDITAANRARASAAPAAAMTPMPGKAVTQALQQLREHYASAVDRDGEEGQCGDCGLAVDEAPGRRDTRHDHCGPLPHTGPVGGPYCARCE